MPETATVYLVTSGSYSDYSVDAVFTTREAAEAYIATMNAYRAHYFENDAWRSYGGDYLIEEMPLDPPTPVYTDGAWRTEIWSSNGKVIASFWTDAATDTPPSVVPIPTIIPPVAWLPGEQVKIQGFGATPEHARRSAEEFRRVYLTERDLGLKRSSPDATKPPLAPAETSRDIAVE